MHEIICYHSFKPVLNASLAFKYELLLLFVAAAALVDLFCSFVAVCVSCCTGSLHSLLNRPVNKCSWFRSALVDHFRTADFFVLFFWQFIGFASYRCVHKAWPSFLRAAPGLISLCHGWPATIGHRVSGRDGQAPDQHQRTETLLPGDGQQHAGPDWMGEEAFILPRTLAQSGWRADDRAAGAAGCKLQSTADWVTACVCEAWHHRGDLGFDKDIDLKSVCFMSHSAVNWIFIMGK